MDQDRQDNKIVDFSYSLTSELELNLRIKLKSFEGHWPSPSFKELIRDPFLRLNTSLNHPDLPKYKDIYATVQPFADNRPLAIPVKTKYKWFADNPLYNDFNIRWDEYISFPISYAHLPVNTLIAITLWYAFNNTGMLMLPGNLYH